MKIRGRWIGLLTVLFSVLIFSACQKDSASGSPVLASACRDADDDGYGQNCLAGGDCDDSDPNNWTRCGTCADLDHDGLYVGCNQYLTILGPDYNDADPGKWSGFYSCVDNDGDGLEICIDWSLTNMGADCDDTNPNVFPGAAEVCDGVDNQCPGEPGYGVVDEGCPTILQIIPPYGWFGQDTNVTIKGTLFTTPAQAWLHHSTLNLTYYLTNPAFVNATTITGTVVAGGMPDSVPYDFYLQMGATVISKALAFTITDVPPPTVTSVWPTSGWNQRDTQITIIGSDFIPVPGVMIGDTNAKNVLYIDSHTLTATVPAGMTPGLYGITVINPDGLSGSLNDAFLVSDNPAPIIKNVSPTSLPSASGGVINITGQYFVPSELMDSTTVFIQAFISNDPTNLFADSVTVQNATTVSLQAIIPGGLVKGIYVVTVQNPDGQYDSYSAIKLCTSADGKLGDAGDFVDSARPLTFARRSHSGEVIQDDLENLFIYVAGGDNGASVFKNIEYTSSSLFGSLSEWNLTRPMNNARTALLLAGARGSDGTPYLYAIGGASVSNGNTVITKLYSNAYKTVERARLLITSTAPINLVVTPVPGGGTLAPGTYVYKVSAELFDGEGLASNPVTVSGDTAGAFSLTWDALAGATKYYVYRVEAANGRAGFEYRLAEVATNAYTDNGSGVFVTQTLTANLTATPSAAGGTLATGAWCYRISGVTVNGEIAASAKSCATVSGAQAVDLAWSDTTGIEVLYYNIYRSSQVGDTVNTYQIEDKIITSSFQDTGLAPMTVAGPGSLTAAAQTFASGAMLNGTYYYAVCGVGDRWTSLPAQANVNLAGAQNSVVLGWAEVKGALSYNVYRGDTLNNEHLIKQGLYATRFADIGLVEGTTTTGNGLISTPSGKMSPLVRGSLGKWQNLAGTLNSPRLGLNGVTALWGNTTYLYVAGGRDGNTVYNTVERALVNADGSLGAWTFEPDSLVQARVHFGFALANSRNHPGIASSTLTYFYAAQGLTTAGTDLTQINWSKIQDATGDLGAWADTNKAPSAAYVGCTSEIGSGYVYVIGGVRNLNTIFSGIKRGTVDAVTGNITANWADASGISMTGRAFHSSAVTNAYMYLIGGQTSNPGSAIVVTGYTEQIPF